MAKKSRQKSHNQFDVYLDILTKHATLAQLDSLLGIEYEEGWSWDKGETLHVRRKPTKAKETRIHVDSSARKNATLLAHLQTFQSVVGSIRKHRRVLKRFKCEIYFSIGIMTEAPWPAVWLNVDTLKELAAAGIEIRIWLFGGSRELTAVSGEPRLRIGDRQLK